MKASVIVPVYNAEKTIERCVESLIYGEFQDIEVILIDDCSKDQSWKKCEQLSKRYSNVIAVRNDVNSGVSFTRNHGLDLASGKYILFADSDDWVSGRYAQRLLAAAEENENALVICGLHFINEVDGYRQDYIWQENGNRSYIVKKEEFFNLQKRFHLQQLWNKVFLHEHIQKNHLRFDVNQNMGEDFQFVLDYMETVRIDECFVINEALYYYVRANKSSLMSKFGIIENENELNRQEQLLRIAGFNSSVCQKEYKNAMEEIKSTAIYYIIRTKLSPKEKIEKIEAILQDGKSIAHYCKGLVSVLKESVATQIGVLKKMPGRILWHFQRVQRDRLVERVRKRISCKEVSIISQNCIGGVVYHDIKMNFLSPTINLYFETQDFLRFVGNLAYYLDIIPIMRWDEEYPIGYVDDVKIYFMHYETCSNALEKWEKRKKRILWEHILILCTDGEGLSDDEYEEWKKIRYPKILFSAQRKQEDDVIYYSQYANRGKVGNLIPKREYYAGDKLVRILNSFGKS